MKRRAPTPEDMDSYIAGFTGEVRRKLEKMREAIRKAAPDALEAISYQIPTFKLSGNLVHFAAFRNHIGFYPTASAIVKFEKELAAYQCSRGTVRFPLDQPLPLKLIGRVAKFRVKENLSKARAKEKRRS